ncbi:MAG: MOSC domain-containing protein [Phycisphaerales bacterium]
MRVLSVNVSAIRTLEYEGKVVETGILKRPVSGRVAVGPLGLLGDAQADRQHHGGEHMAVYVINRDIYDHWRREEQREDFEFGTFGENLTVEGMPDDDVHLGDRFAMGTAEVEVSLPRGPCATLGMAVRDPGFPKRYLSTCRVGFYLRVLTRGEVGAGDAVVRRFTHPDRVSIMEATRTYYFEAQNAAAARRVLGVSALGPLWRERLIERSGG